jgi:hypothetical protein
MLLFIAIPAALLLGVGVLLIKRKKKKLPIQNLEGGGIIMLDKDEEEPTSPQ